MIRGSGALFLVLTLGASLQLARAQSALAPEFVANLGALHPVMTLATPEDDGRLFIVCRQGPVLIMKENALLPTPFIDLPGLPSSGFLGLLGMAFDPAYDSNGWFYLYTAELDDTIRLTRYQVSADPNIADLKSATPIFSAGADPFDTHFGGSIAFDPKGALLYIATGDANLAGNDLENRSQDLTSLFGKMLRIDPHGDDFPDDPEQNYAIPMGNPLAGVRGGARQEIYAYGLRNPWRPAFDCKTGDLYIPDVGANDWEEINVRPASDAALKNYGWRCREGFSCTIFGAAGCPDCETAPFEDPVFVYSHEEGRCSIIGGVVYRGAELEGYDGHFFFSDYCTGEVFSMTPSGSKPLEVQNHSEALGNAIRPLRTSVSSGPGGEIYLCSRLGDVWKISVEGVSECEWDLAADGVVGAADLAQLIGAWGNPYTATELAELIGSWGPCD